MDRGNDVEVVVAEFAHRYEAELAQGYLQDAGIESMVTMDDASSMDTGMTFPKGARLIVLRESVERALEVLRAANVIDA
jgi:hypothetical protein